MSRPGLKETYVVCLGASVVEGRVSANFVQVLIRRMGSDGYRFVNAGRAGDQSIHVLRRLDSVLAEPPDVVVVLVGSNDVTATLDAALGRMAMRAAGLKVAPTIDSYRENMRAVVRRLRDAGVRVGLCSLTVLGESMASEPNRAVAAYSAVLEDVAAQEAVDYIPIFEAQTAWLHKHLGSAGRPLEVGGLLRAGMGVLIRHLVLRQDLDRISRLNGYALTVDGQHMNSVGAALIADRVEQYLRSLRRVL
jgi:lysophospholipase L1-like esterase